MSNAPFETFHITLPVDLSVLRLPGAIDYLVDEASRVVRTALEEKRDETGYYVD